MITELARQRDDANAKLALIRDACEAALDVAVGVQLAEDVIDIIDGKDET